MSPTRTVNVPDLGHYTRVKASRNEPHLYETAHSTCPNRLVVVEDAGFTFAAPGVRSLADEVNTVVQWTEWPNCEARCTNSNGGLLLGFPTGGEVNLHTRNTPHLVYRALQLVLLWRNYDQTIRLESVVGDTPAIVDSQFGRGATHARALLMLGTHKLADDYIRLYNERARERFGLLFMNETGRQYTTALQALESGVIYRHVTYPEIQEILVVTNQAPGHRDLKIQSFKLYPSEQ